MSNIVVVGEQQTQGQGKFLLDKLAQIRTN